MDNEKVESHSEEDTLRCCIQLMNELVGEFEDWYRWIHGDDAIEELEDEERFCVNKTYFKIVQHLFLRGTSHSGGTSTIQKCRELNVKDWSDTIAFGFEVDEDE